MLLTPLILLIPAAQEPTVSASKPVALTPQWTTSLETYYIEPPHASGYLSAILSADRGPLHLEVHWAYEDRDTLAVFVGKSFPIEGDIKGVVTPRIGIAGGDSDGIVPALGLTLNWKQLTFSTDVEYMIGTSSETRDFLYSWSELSWAINERFSVGIVGQRTNVFSQELSVDRGLLFSVSVGRTYFTAYLFNLDEDDPYVSLSVGASF